MESTGPSRTLRIAAVPLMLVAGAMVALQSQINGHLAHRLGTGPRAGFAAAVISFGSGLVLLALMVALQRGQRANARSVLAAVRDRRLRPLEMVGGLFGAFVVASQGITVATIGVAVFSVALTAGQACSALAVDHFGLGPSGHQRVDVSRAVAAAFAVVAVCLASWSALVDAFSWKVALFTAIPFLAGAGSSLQQAINGRVARVAEPLVTTLNNFLVGTAALLVAFGLSLLAGGTLRQLPGDWWLYLGGVIGMTFIWLAALLVHVHGVLVLGLSMIAGQVIGAEIIEAVADGAPPSTAKLAAAALTVVGVVVALALRKR